jgi:hypothetical protein
MDKYVMQYSCKSVVLLPVDKRGSCVETIYRMPRSLLLGMFESADFSSPESGRVGDGGWDQRWNADILKRRIYKSGGTGDIQLSISPTGKGMQTGVEGPRGQDQGKGDCLDLKVLMYSKIK